MAITAFAVALGGCTRGDASETALPGHLQTMEPTAAAELPVDDAAVVLTVAREGNEVRYRVREQLVGRDLPNDAVGVTSAVSGVIALDAQGNVIPGSSRIVVDVTGLRSDQERRDGYLQRRLLETEQYPTVEFHPTALRGISLPLPSSGSRTFELSGDLTVKGVTRPTTWQVNARFANQRITGSAATAFTFEHFGLTQPRVPVVLSVADTIRLEYDFNLIPGR